MKPIFAILCTLGVLHTSPVAAEEGHRSSYYKDGEHHVNVLGTPEEKAITTGHWDFKPSWSKTGDMVADGTFTDFNPTWTRDGKNTATSGDYIMTSKVGGKPGEEIALADKRYQSWVHSAVTDGRLLVASTDAKADYRYPHGEATPN